jgi:apolipoprotein N-acyltransferase
MTGGDRDDSSQRRVGLAFPVIAGIAGGLCWLPLGLAPLLPVACFLAMRGLRRVNTGREAVVFGLVFGAVRWAVAGHFLLALLRFSPLAIVFYLLAILYVLPFSVLESWGAVSLERRCGLPRSIGFGLLYVTLEWVRTLGEISFPADQLAHAFGDRPEWLAWSSWTGPFGVTLLIVATAILLDSAWEQRRTLRLAIVLAAASLVLWSGPLLTGLILDRSPAAAPRMSIGLVQPSRTVEEKHDRDLRPETWERMERLTREAARDADLVVWPETARPDPLIWRSGAPFSDRRMEILARRVGVPILYGCEIARVGEGRVEAFYNGAAIAYPDGRPGEWYAKRQLLPFAEGVPYAGLIGYDPHADGGKKKTRKRRYLSIMGNFDPGHRPTIFEVGEARIGVLICYEGMYPELSRTYRNAGANVLAVLTNDAWWGRSVFARWHALMASSLARELDVPVIRAANSGVSSNTDSDGVMRASTGLFEVVTMEVEVSPATTGPTVYARFGQWVIWGVASFLGVAVVWSVVRSKKSPASRIERPGKGEEVVRARRPRR